jgi:hypothetical protein
MLRM